MPIAPHPLTERFARIIATLVAMLGARLERPGKPGLAGPLTAAIHIRLQRIRNRITRYVAHWQTGRLRPPRPRTRPAAARPRKTGPGKWEHLPQLPRGPLWLVRLVPGIGVGANYLRILLDDPEMQAMMQAAPQIGRTLRPLWHMLSRDPLPDILRPPRPTPLPEEPPARCPTPPQRTPPPQPGRPAPRPAPEIAAPILCPPGLSPPGLSPPGLSPPGLKTA